MSARPNVKAPRVLLSVYRVHSSILDDAEDA